MDDLIPIVAIVSVFGLPLFIVWVIFHFNSKNKAAILETIRVAAQNGTALTPEIVQSLGVQPKHSGNDIRSGMLWLAVGLACVVLGWTISAFWDDGLRTMIGVASFPGFIGLTLIAMGVLMPDKSQNAE